MIIYSLSKKLTYMRNIFSRYLMKLEKNLLIIEYELCRIDNNYGCN
jgi:hypothetical protein